MVGNAGLLGAMLVICLSFGITAFTGLSLSSITTNIRIGAGGAFNVISQSLGLEVGGSIGVPLYVSQALAVVMYIFGFRAGWTWLFPDHPALLVDLFAFAALFAIAFVSAGLAFKVQYVILAAVVMIHAYLVKKQLEAPYSDVRSGLFMAMAEWAAKKADDIVGSRERTWIANMLVPVQRPEAAEGLFELLRDLTRPKGFVRLLGLSDHQAEAELQTGLAERVERFKAENVFTSWTVVQAAEFHENMHVYQHVFAACRRSCTVG